MSDESVDPATKAILSLPLDRAHREALRAHEALMRYGRRLLFPAGSGGT